MDERDAREADDGDRAGNAVSNCTGEHVVGHDVLLSLLS
jgi:hypothetical protein